MLTASFQVFMHFKWEDGLSAPVICVLALLDSPGLAMLAKGAQGARAALFLTELWGHSNHN